MGTDHKGVVIRHNKAKKTDLTIIGVFLLIGGAFFLYLGIPYGASIDTIFCFWLGAFFLCAGIFLSGLGLSKNNPIIIATQSNVTFFFSSSKKLIVPWEAITQIAKEKVLSRIGGRGCGQGLDCIVFRIQDEFYRQIPSLTSPIYLRKNGKIYFADSTISMSVDKGVSKLNCIRPSHCPKQEVVFEDPLSLEDWGLLLNEAKEKGIRGEEQFDQFLRKKGFDPEKVKDDIRRAT